MQKDRVDILRFLIASNVDKILSKDVRQKMKLDKMLFSQLLTKTEDIEIRPYKISLILVWMVPPIPYRDRILLIHPE
jgi:hypothetical protein